jgi:predicted amidohydrolase YtcJ
MRTLYRAAAVYAAPDPTATALVVDGEQVLWAGRPGDPGIGPVERTVDLGNALIAPAFVDAHVHLTETGLAIRGVDLREAGDVSTVLDLVAAAARRDPDGPVLGHGWDEGRLAEGRPPTGPELDRAAPGRLVYLSRVDVHSAVISGPLAEAAGTRGADGWDDSGRVERDAHHAARRAARTVLTGPARRAAQLTALQAAAAAGIGAVHEMSGPDLVGEHDLRELAELTADPGQALPEVTAYRAQLVASAEQARQVLAGLGAPVAGLGGDLCVDGSVGSRTAAYREDYQDVPGHRGHLYLTVDQVRDHVAACTRVGIQAGFHVIGDAASDVVRRGVRRAAEQVGIAAVRAAGHRLEHIESIDAEGIADLADLGLTASVQPAFDALWGGPAGMYAVRLGGRRAAGMNPFAAMAAAGVRLAFGSDTPVTPFDPWGAVRAAVRHHTADQRLDVAAAFAAHTIGGHRAAPARVVAGELAGRLVPGAPATFAVWQLPEPAVPGGLPDLDDDRPAPRCLLTLAAGRPLFEVG